MRRFFALMLMACMLMSTVAFAEQSTVLQDEQPPKVVTTVNEEGETIIARICDVHGNVIAEIKDDGTLVLTDVHHREDAGSSIVVTRLTDAYASIMDDVHHSDVECQLHDHDVKVDINDVLASLNEDIEAYDLVMYELFDIMPSEEIAGLLVDGNYLEVTLELVEEQTLPMITMFTPDGRLWNVIPTESAGDNRFTVRLTEPGTVALLSDGRETAGIGESVQRVVTVIPGEDAGEFGIDMPNFTPSVSGKPAPQMVTFVGEDGETYIGYIRNNGGDIEILVPDKNYVHVTSVAERDHIADIQTHEHLEWAYDSILEVEDVGELFTEHDMSVVIPDHAHGTIAGLLDETLAQMGLDLTHDQLVVKDLFEVTAYGEYLHHLYDEDYYLEVTFDASLDPDRPLVVIHSPDSMHWHVHSPEDVVLNADGSVTLRMYDLGSVAFLVAADETVDAETAVQSPN